MRAVGWTTGTGWALAALLAALWCLPQPASANEPAAPGHLAGKADRLVVGSGRGDLESRPADVDQPVRELRGPPARRLIDVAIRDDGVWLNSFATSSMPLDGASCGELSDDIVSRLHLPADAVQRLAQEDLMRQTRVCAVNGSLILTCYGGAATVSLRQPQHGDGCEAHR